jgi:glycine oxidase
LRHYAGTVRNGSLVVAPARDAAELTRFAARTENFEWRDADGIAALEPDLAGRFRRALFFPREAHLEPRRALPALAEALTRRGVPIRLGVDKAVNGNDGDFVIDCRGLAARDGLTDLRGVRGEMVMVRSREVSLSRPVRLLHPRIPLYIVPRGDGVFMVGATAIESEAKGGVSVRSAVELLNAAYALHPAFGEAEILELGADLRPAFSDNLPAVRRCPNGLRVNGLYRHGFLLAPAMARVAADIVESDNADLRQRRSA